MNQVTLLGRCGRTPELSGSEDTPYAIINLATTHEIRQAGENDVVVNQ